MTELTDDNTKSEDKIELDIADASFDLNEANEDEEENGERDGQQDEEGDEFSADAKALEEELKKLVIIAPPMNRKPSLIMNLDDYPPSYKENTSKEKLVQKYAENFRRQYVHLYRDKKPLLLSPYNECGVEKFVCTTVQKTQLSYQELNQWEKAAEYVSDYLNFEPLDPPYELPRRMLSSYTVLKQQLGNCFEYSTLLCSLLIGAGYDAYVVSGYADRETCLMDETRDICPFMKKKEEESQKKVEKPLKKYTVRPPRDLRSKYELMMEERQQKAELAEEELERKLALEAEAELEKPPPDSLFGLRVHSWVLVLEGKRQVAESFFIEPFTGLPHPLKSIKYHGIESLWNHQNYWVNMQECSEGVVNMTYDLGDSSTWEFMFPSNTKPILNLPTDEDELNDEEDEEENEDVERHLDMPPSWAKDIELTLKDFQMRYPSGKKTTLYKRVKLEQFAPYLMRDGLVTRLSQYHDKELSQLLKTKEYFKNRVDQLQMRDTSHQTGLIVEYFNAGKSSCLKEHEYLASSPGPESERTMLFYHEARVDGLVKREESPTTMSEEFLFREDYLYHRFVEFGKRVKKFGPSDQINTRPIIKMIEKFHRNPLKNANEDMAVVTYLVAEEKIHVLYHTDSSKISASTREFIKPPNADEKGAVLVMTPDMYTTYQVDPDNYNTKQVELYQLMLSLLDSEEKCRGNARMGELEVEEILNDRAREESAAELEISVYDTMRNEKARKHRQELEAKLLEESRRKQEMELDYLGPFLAQMGFPDKPTKAEVFKLKEDCLADLKQKLIDKANLIQARFELETLNLQKKQAWYQQNQISMQKDDEEDYLNYCSEAMFRIHILEVRLNRHKEMAPHKYMELEKKLRLDPRLSEYL